LQALQLGSPREWWRIPCVCIFATAQVLRMRWFVQIPQAAPCTYFIIELSVACT
jgi:hypothetical protein